jgi:hypothetical protein
MTGTATSALTTADHTNALTGLINSTFAAARPRRPVSAESVVLMTPRSTYAVAFQPCESMVCKFSPYPACKTRSRRTYSIPVATASAL